MVEGAAMTRYYAGIGSRETPEAVQRFMSQVAMRLAHAGYTLRSGGAEGADTAFEQGCDDALGAKEIYLPWKGFNGNPSPLYTQADTAQMQIIAMQHHPAWSKLSHAAKLLHARNVCQVLGADGNTPSEFVVCWTPRGSGSGGTGQAIRIAGRAGVPVYDLGTYSPEWLLRKLKL